MKGVKGVIALLLLFSLVSCTNESGGKKLEKKIGQMLLIGFKGYELNEKSRILEDINQGLVGGVILYSYDGTCKTEDRNIRSPEQLKILCQTLQSHSRTPLIIAVDQEGGKVSRLSESLGFPPTVSALFLGQQNDISVTRIYAARCAKLLRDMGINLNLAPVVDLNTNPNNLIDVKQRSYSKDPKIVISHAEAFIDEHHKEKIMTALKHFPGHGSSNHDSHLGFVDISKTWSEDELEPFFYLNQKNRADVVMTGHVFHEKLDPDYPATLSKPIIRGLLRQKIGYTGIVISDDLQMKAISDHYDFELVLEKAINADVDILLFGNHQAYDERIAEKVIHTVVKLIKEKRISSKQIDNAYKRIMRFKRNLPKD